LGQKVRAAWVSVGSNLVLVAAKLTVGLMTGAVSVLSEAINSAVDVVAAVITLVGVRVASQPADQEHRYGHGKVENVTALIEGLLILTAAGWILYEAAHRLGENAEAPWAAPALWVMGLSALTKYLVSGYLFRVAQSQDSAALRADAVNLQADVWSSLAVFTGLLLVHITAIRWIDPILAMAVAGVVARSGWRLVCDALKELIDVSLPDEEEEEIVQIIEQYSEGYLEFHDLRTRRAGAERHIDFHLVVHGSRPLQAVHRLCDQIEAAIEERFVHAQVLIHPEPCGENCDVCSGRRLLVRTRLK
jgi:cation diffusion facilitator family transporter